MENDNKVQTTADLKPAQQTKALAPWKQALANSEARFLAISDPIKTKQELGFASMLISANPQLQTCDPNSIINAVINVARTGITLNPVLKLAHLVPRGGKCVLDFDYKGLVKVLKDNGCVKHIDAIIVYEDEEFEESDSPITAPKHVKKYAKTETDQNKRQMYGVYCRVLLPDGTMVYTQIMPAWEILKTEATATGASSKYSPWKAWKEEMWKKTKIKRDFKTLISGSPNEQLSNALKIEEENTGMTFKANGNSIADTFGEAEEAEVIS